MISYLQAKQIAENEINSRWGIPGDSPLLLEDRTIERHYAWIFSYTSKRLHETPDPSYRIAGIGPFFVFKSDGGVKRFGSGFVAETAIHKYEEDNKIWSLQLKDAEIYNDVQKLRYLKEVIGISTHYLIILKSTLSVTIDSGAEAFLLKNQKELSEKGIATVIVANELLREN